MIDHLPITFGFFFLKKNSWKKRDGDGKNYMLILKCISLLTLGDRSSIEVIGDEICGYVDKANFEKFREGYALVSFNFSSISSELECPAYQLRDFRCLSYYSFEQFKLIRRWVGDNHINDVTQLCSKLFLMREECLSPSGESRIYNVMTL